MCAVRTFVVSHSVDLEELVILFVLEKPSTISVHIKDNENDEDKHNSKECITQSLFLPV